MRYILIFLVLYSSLIASRDGGPYIGLGYGISQYNDDKYYTDMKEDSSESATFYVGAYINKHLSVELSYVSFDAKGLGDSFLVNKDSSSDETINFYATTISTLAHYPILNDKLDLYARFGAGEMGSNIANDNGFTLVYGVGIAYRFNETFETKLAYDSYHFGFDINEDKSSEYRMVLDYLYMAIEVQF